MQKDFDLLYGMPIIISNSITKEVRRRTHRKKRIDKKWLKRYGFKSVPDNDKVIVFENKLIMTQICHDRLEQYIVKGGSYAESVQ